MYDYISNNYHIVSHHAKIESFHLKMQRSLKNSCLKNKNCFYAHDAKLFLRAAKYQIGKIQLYTLSLIKQELTKI